MLETLTQTIRPGALTAFEVMVNNWIFVASFAFLAFEFLRYLAQKRFSLALFGDTVANFVTLIGFFVVSYAALATAYIAVYYGASQFALFDIEVNAISVAICLILADLAYYWEHRFTHRVNLAWATHTVHHSSPHFNISVAYRFGPMDGIWPIFFHVPLVLLGFHPLLVFFAEVMVQAYQTFLHTEVIGKFPRPVEAVMNTPSHHRVHHGSDDEYIDRNYGGIFIIWDRMFGTHAVEDKPVTYGLTKPINSVNPLVIWFHGFTRLGREFLEARGTGQKLRAVFGAPAAAITDRGFGPRSVPTESQEVSS